MTSASEIKVTINFNDPDLDNDERDQEVDKLLPQIRELEGVTSDRVLDPNPPEGNKAIGGVLAGLLMAEVNLANFKKLMEFLGDRLGNKPIELEVEANGKKLKVKASSREELEAAIASAQKFIEV
jgi:hypothetical protein